MKTERVWACAQTSFAFRDFGELWGKNPLLYREQERNAQKLVTQEA